MYYKTSLFFSVILAILLLSGCDPFFPGSPHTGRAPGVVFTQTNDTQANEIVAYKRDAKGQLTESGRYETGGQGSGSGLGSQGAVVLSKNNRLLLTVNAGSNELSVFNVKLNSIELVDVITSGGEQPVSVTVQGSLVYVVHAGGSGNITGFRLSGEKLAPIPGSTQNLSNDGEGAAPGPAQIEFTPDGNHVIVTEKPSNMIGVYPVDKNGVAGPPTFTASSGNTPFGFSFSKKNVLIVSEAFGGADQLSATSSYKVSKDGSVELISGSVTSNQTAACWAVTTKNGRYTYISNTQSGTITGYSVSNRGVLKLIDENGVTGDTGGSDSIPIDMALSNNSKFLYVLNSGTNTIFSYEVHSDGSLSSISSISVPATSAGLIAI